MFFHTIYGEWMSSAWWILHDIRDKAIDHDKKNMIIKPVFDYQYLKNLQ